MIGQFTATMVYVTHDQVEAMTGLDVELPGDDCATHLKEAVDRGLISTETIDDIVSRVLLEKMRLGLFEKPYTDEDAIVETGKPVVLVLTSGRPYNLGGQESRHTAQVMAFFGGEQAGNALARVLTGAVEPSGRLTLSIPRNAGATAVCPRHAGIAGETDQGAEVFQPCSVGCRRCGTSAFRHTGRHA